ncbi:hypothetical protein C1645_755163 [Glomus cerebriforme]|uniref:KAP NTPase domain-containing protein n=1 Tax=Glomus cerebriforme TaxID=658196 RepID=A0A397TDM6_9GLOM|nr:hypothetical protein C1645_755163 [Glomus cerebriforme]
MYKKKYNKPPVIVYDNFNQIDNNYLKILDILKEDAKDNADDREYITVFVINKESILKRMECKYLTRLFGFFIYIFMD